MIYCFLYLNFLFWKWSLSSFQIIFPISFLPLEKIYTYIVTVATMLSTDPNSGHSWFIREVSTKNWGNEFFLILNMKVKESGNKARGWDSYMAWWTRLWTSSRSWWWTGKPDVLQSMGSQRVRHNWVTELSEPKGHKTAEEKSTKETTEAVRELELVP